METDAVALATTLFNAGVDRLVIKTLVDVIKSLMSYEFHHCIISHVSRVCNSIADTLAAIGLNCINGLQMWHDNVTDL